MSPTYRRDKITGRFTQVPPEEEPRLESFEDAKQYSDSVVVFEGDRGGIIYALVPFSLIKCTEKELDEAMNIFNAFEFQNYTEKEWDGYIIKYIRNLAEIIEYYHYGEDLVEEKGLWLMDYVNHLRPQVESILFKK